VKKHPNPKWFILVELPDIALPQEDIVIGQYAKLADGTEIDPDVDLVAYRIKGLLPEHIFINVAERKFRIAEERKRTTFYNGQLLKPGWYSLYEGDTFNFSSLQLTIQFIPAEGMWKRAYEVAMFPGGKSVWTPWNPEAKKLTELELFDGEEIPMYLLIRASGLAKRMAPILHKKMTKDWVKSCLHICIMNDNAWRLATYPNQEGSIMAIVPI
jgi:hypothetical protein